MKIETVATVRETDKSYCDAIDFQFGNDPSAVTVKVLFADLFIFNSPVIYKHYPINIKTIFQFGSEVGKVGEDLLVTISYVNPLPIPLTDLKITLEGPGLVAPTSGSIA